MQHTTEYLDCETQNVVIQIMKLLTRNMTQYFIILPFLKPALYFFDKMRRKLLKLNNFFYREIKKKLD